MENSRGPSFAPAANQLGVGEHGLGVVRRVVRRRHAEGEVGRSGQLDCASRPLDSPPTCPCTSMMPGMIVLPFTSIAPRAGRHLHRDDGPTAVMRLPSTTHGARSR